MSPVSAESLGVGGFTEATGEGGGGVTAVEADAAGLATVGATATVPPPVTLLGPTGVGAEVLAPVGGGGGVGVAFARTGPGAFKGPGAVLELGGGGGELDADCPGGGAEGSPPSGAVLVEAPGGGGGGVFDAVCAAGVADESPPTLGGGGGGGEFNALWIGDGADVSPPTNGELPGATGGCNGGVLAAVCAGGGGEVVLLATGLVF